MNDVNAALPENAPVPSAHPQYLAVGNSVDLNLQDSADVWVTFVHEGAGYRNVLGYYVYETANPPQTKNDIDSVRIIFPNVSYSGSGGGLTSGNKVYLGAYGASKSIGWVLLRNAWSNGSVNTSAQKFYSEPSFNPESSPSQQQHVVQLYHLQRDIVLIGFEDTARNESGCDNDFNDAVFYASSNPIEAIPKTGMPEVSGNANNDQDNDGVDDNSDEFPNDPTRAFTTYFPNSGQMASVAFEDLWPSKGDYDFNDLVVHCQHAYVINASNQIVDIEMKFYVKHIGASYRNGFGVELPVSASDVASVVGYNHTTGIVNLTSAGIEAGQSKAVIIPFDDAFENLGDTLTISITLNATYSMSLWNQVGLNPFIFVDGTRSREVHLSGKAPTDLMDLTLFGQGADRSNPAEGRYYMTDDHMPWALSINNSFAIPREKVRIEQAYLKFDDWATSAGASWTDWYSNTSSGYRNNSNLQ